MARDVNHDNALEDEVALPDRIKHSELNRAGYAIQADGRAKHKRYSSWRHRCTQCGDWVKQAIKGLCRDCNRKRVD